MNSHERIKIERAMREPCTAMCGRALFPHAVHVLTASAVPRIGQMCAEVPMAAACPNSCRGRKGGE